MLLIKHYTKLGLTTSANFADVKKAYRKLAFRYHPDHNHSQEAKKQFIDIQEAYSAIEEYCRFGTVSTNKNAQTYSANHKETTGNHRRKPRKRPNQQEYRNAQKRRQNEKNQKDQELYSAIFNKFCSSWRIRYVRAISVVLIGLGSIIMLDFSLGSDAEMIHATHQDFMVDDSAGFILIDNCSYKVPQEIYYSVLDRFPIIVYRTKIFKDIRTIESIKPIKIRENPASMVNYAPFTMFLFIIPALGFLYKRPDFNYTFFFIHYSMYLAPLIMIYFFASNLRAFRLIEAIWLVIK